MDSNQNQRRREIQESGWHSAARCGSIRNSIKWSTPLTLMATVQTQTDQRGEMVRNYKDEGSTTKDEQTGDQEEMDYIRFKTTQTEVQQL